MTAPIGADPDPARASAGSVARARRAGPGADRVGGSAAGSSRVEPRGRRDVPDGARAPGRRVPHVVRNAYRRWARRRGFGLFAVQVGVITLVALVAAGIAVAVQAAQVREAAEERVVVLARTVASLPVVAEALRSDDPSAVIQPVTSAMEQASGAEYIAVVDMDGIRVAHPQPELVGQPVSSDHSAIRAGEEFSGAEQGPMGVTLRAKVPVRAVDGEIVGTVSVGILLSAVQREVAVSAAQIAVPALAAVLLGTFVAWRVTAGLRRRLFGVEPDEMLALVQSRQAMTDGVQDGFVGVDANGRIAFVNPGAQRLLGVTGSLTGDEAASVLPAEIAAFLADGSGRATRQLRSRGRTLVATRSTAVADGREVGAMLVLQDRSELESMLRTLEDERRRSRSLRAEAHDFDNRMHVVAGLLGLGELDDARAYLAGLPRAERPGAAAEWSRIGSPLVAALLASRRAQAEAAGVVLALAEDSVVDGAFVCDAAAVTVLGNLVSNAIEAASARVEVYVSGDAHGLELVVDDDGDGVPAADAQRIFERGTTSKRADPWRHGIGLDVVRGFVLERGGELSVTTAELGGARFSVVLPSAPTSAVSS
ncbi:sensor histidine kinase [Pseudoclavibacter chungangensis]|uniref:histidine kinase n=1 Tax=Pseudoclavibacter chungangensis TaxID=587635 RepID=A0A7J5BP90_9MICO|nr:sensor histidine kinase [Pseudoclavibacter chungangensis]KAB1653837.1 sensor histidine kinase [Pseudoclavibacter chungangensis]NYJ68151.1 two-component system CitB family sensor kinase [Pseudoclavibacter chungangensis]